MWPVIKQLGELLGSTCSTKINRFLINIIRAILKKPLKKDVVLKRRKILSKFDISTICLWFYKKMSVTEIDLFKYFSHLNTQIQFDRTAVFNSMDF